MRGGVEPQTLCVLQTPTRNPLMYETRILVGTEGVEPYASEEVRVYNPVNPRGFLTVLFP